MKEETKIDTAQHATIICKNCDTEFIGNFCPHCGQSKKDYDQPFRFIIADFAGNLFAFDARVWKSVKSLWIAPGQMAHDYVTGKRARYMPPFRLYVFVSFIFFMLLSFTSNKNPNIINIGNDTEEQIKEENPELFDEFVKIKTDSSIIEKLNNADVKIKGVNDSTKTSIKAGKNREFDFNDINEHKEMYMSKFFKWLSWSLFILMPLYAGLLWLFFKRTHPYYLGHLVLAINQHAFTFLVFIIIMLVNIIFPNKNSAPESNLLWILPVYFVLGARKLYHRKWTTLILRFTVIHGIYLLAITACITLAAYLVFSKM